LPSGLCNGERKLAADFGRFTGVRVADKPSAAMSSTSSRSPKLTDQGFTTLNWLAGLAKRPRTEGLPMFEVMAAETLCTPTVENLTVKSPFPTMRPKLTRKVFGEKVALGSVEFKVTV